MCADALPCVGHIALAAAFGYLAIRYRVGGWWLAAAEIQVALLAAAAKAQLIRSDLPGQSQLTIGVGLQLAEWLQAIQLLLPLSVGWLCLRASSRRARAVA